MHLKNVTLELSSKPFTDESEATMFSVCRKMFTQWLDLIRSADQVSVMLWIADGSEIFEYTGDLNQRFEWAYWCGCANHCPQPEHPTERMKRNTHIFPVKYRADAAPRPYSWLKRLIEVLRETGTEITGKAVRIGATYDNGPEFAISPFKYKKHREIAQAHTIYPNSFVTCTARLHADPQPYAAFPDGIPEGTSVGTFLGRQFRVFAKDLGFDYLWLSNGMGFGTETWGITGMLFDKHAFHPEKAKEEARKALETVGLWDKAGENPYDLELGERKMVAIASVLAMDTDVVILDEPTIAQDFAGRSVIAGAIRELKKRGKLVLAILHDMDFVAECFERVIVMAHGAILADGDAGTVFAMDDVLQKARLQKPSVARLCRRLSGETGEFRVCLTVEEFLQRNGGTDLLEKP